MTSPDTKRPELDCHDVAARLSALIDDEISADDRLIAERHLAQCADCRRLVDEAEAVDMMIRVDAYGGLEGAADALPAGFEDAVIAATVGPPPPAQGPWRFAAFAGWVAAAAALGFAAFVWTSNPGPSNQPDLVTRLVPVDDDAVYVQTPSDIEAPMGPAWGADRPGMDQPGMSAAQLAGFGTPNGAHMNSAALSEMPPITIPAADDALMGPFDLGFTLTDDEADAVEQASRLMQRLSNASTSTFADVEHIRRTADAAKVIERLNAIAERAPEAEQGVLRSVEAALLRIKFGPIGQADIAELRDYADQRDLSDRLAAFSDAFAPRRSF